MEGLSQEVLSFLIDIQEHGANQLRALSTDFNALGTTADRIGARLKVLEGQLAKTGAASASTGERVAASSKAAADATAKQAAATTDLSRVQKEQTTQASGAATATGRLAGAQKEQAAQAKATTAATGQQAKATHDAAAASGAAATQLGRHSGQLTEHTKRLEKVKSATHEFGSSMGAISYPLLATGAVAIKMGVDFEASMSRLHTQAGYAERDVKSLESTVIKAAPALRRTPTELAEGLYHVASVGIPAADAMKVVAAASVGANIGASNFAQTANALVIVLKSMHQPGSEARADMALLNEIVGAGNMHMEDLVGSLGKVLPAAGSFGVSLRNVGAALDVLTARGIGANMAATRLQMTFNLLGAPKPTAVKALGEIGLSAHQLGEDLRKPDGIVSAISDLKHHLDQTFPAGGHKLSLDQSRAALETYKKSLEETGVSGKALETETKKYAEQLAHAGTAATEQARVLSTAFGGGRQSATILALVNNVSDLRKSYNRLPEGIPALKKLQDAQAVWEKTSQAQFDAVKAQISTTLTQIGKNLAPVVLPILKDIASEISAITEAFEKLPKGAQHVIEAFVGILAVAAPVASLVSKFAGAALVMEKLGGHGGPGGKTAVPGALGSALGGSGIYGWKGPTMPGSIMNPIAVVMMGSGASGQLVPPGQLTSSEASKAEGAVRAETKGGVLLPPGAAAEAELAGSGALGAGAVTKAPGLLSKLGKGAGALLGRAGTAGMIGLGGMAVSDLAGGLIGGHTGKAVSTIGSDAAMGAAIGTMIEPGIGTAIGAGFGGVIGAIKVLQGPSHAERVASQTVEGRGQPHLDNTTKAAVEAAVKHSTEMADREVKRVEGNRRVTGMDQQGRQRLAPLTYSQEHTIATTRQAASAFQGQQAGAAEAHYVLSGVKFPELTSITRVAKDKMAELPPIARKGYADMIRAAVEQLEKEKRLPEDSLRKLNRALGNSFGSLAKEAGGAGALSIKALADNLTSGKALSNAKGLVEQLRKTWSGIPAAADVTSRQAGAMFQQDGDRLKQIIATTSGEQKKEAEKAYSELQKNAGVFYGATAKEAERNLETLAKHTGPLSKAGTIAVERNYEQMRKTIEAEVRLGVLSPKQGLEQLAKVSPPLAESATNPVMKAYATMRSHIEGAMSGTEAAVQKTDEAIVKKTHTALETLIGKNAATNLGAAPAGSHAGGPGKEFGPGEFLKGATGMRVPGSGLLDTVPILGRKGGVRGVVAPGELLIANRHTEARINEKLAPYGTSLAHEVLTEGTPHSSPMKRYATGGWANVIASAEVMGGLGYHSNPIQARGYSELSVPPSAAHAGTALGSLPYLTHMRIRAGKREVVAAKQDIGAGSSFNPVMGLYPGTQADLGLTGGEYHVSIERADGVPLTGGAIAAAAGAGGPPPAIPRVRMKIPGLIGRAAQAAVNRVRAGANRRLAAAAAAAGPGGGAAGQPGAGGAPTGGGFAPADLGTFDGLQVASWIIPELAYARAHGWTGHITSGYRPGYDPHAVGGHSRHALDIYPGGAVDFGGMVDPAALANRAAFLNAAAGYPGKRLLLPQGFRDDGHMSGTGHQRGGAIGFAGAFGSGGAVTASSPTMAMFGERGPETAFFLPHAATSAEIGRGIVPEGGSSSKPEKATEGYNPTTKAIEHHTPKEWAHIHALHAQQSAASTAAKHHEAAIKAHPTTIDVGHSALGSIETKEPGKAIDIPGGLTKLSIATWKKVLAFVEAFIAKTDPGQAVQLAGKLTHDAVQKHAGDHTKALAASAIEGAGKTTLTALKAAPEGGPGIAAGGPALSRLDQVLKDAKKTGNAKVTAVIVKDEETALKTTFSRITKLAEAAPTYRAEAADSQAIGQLSRLAAQASKRGAKQLELSIFKQIGKTVTNWMSSISSTLSKTQTAQSTTEKLKITQANIARGPGARPVSSGTDLAYLKQEEAADKHAIDEMTKARAAIEALMKKERAEIHALQVREHNLIAKQHKLLKQLQAREAAARKHHHKAEVKALQAEIHRVEVQLGETQAQLQEVETQLGESGSQVQEIGTAMAETQLNVAELQAEYQKSVYEAVKETIAEADEVFQAHLTAAANSENLAQGVLHREGKDFGGLEELKAKQEGVLTPAQIAQAQADLRQFIQGHEAQIAQEQGQKGYDESQVGNLQGADQRNMLSAIEGLAVSISELENGIYDQKKATEKLTEATNSNTKAYGGSVGFEFQGQQYAVGGQSSASADNVMVGV